VAMNLKERLGAGEFLVGMRGKAGMGTPRIEAAREAGYDFIHVDAQHAPFDEQAMVEFCSRAEELDMPVTMRIKHTLDAYLIGRYCDLGVCGVEVPEVMTDTTVRESLNAFYYPPTGRRGWGGNHRLGFREHSGRIEYAEFWNRTGTLWIQVESIEAVTNAGLLAHSGVDILSFGPQDLAFSIEAHPGTPFDTLEKCIRHVVDQLEGSSTAVAIRSSGPEERGRFQDMGIRVLLERAPRQ